MGKNVAVFVDVANVFYAAKAAGVDIDYVTLLKSVTAGRDFVRAYAYTGLDPDNENQRNFHQFLARHQYKVVSKDIRKYGDGKVKANLDIELVVDLMKTARNLDVAVIVSGDGDFASAIRAVQEMGVRVEVVSFRGNTSSDLIEVADLFTDIIHIAKVDRGSTASGRRVSGDDEDLSMTEVPDKLSEGSGRSRGRGRGRDRSDREGGYAGGSRGGRSSSGRDRGRDSAREPGREAVVSPTGMSSVGLVALPGEKLSRAAAGAAAPVENAELPEEFETPEEGMDAAPGDAELEGEGEAPRRRRRRGGRGRGRGRRDDQVEGGEPVEAGGADVVADVEGEEIKSVADAEVEGADEVEQGEAVAPTAPTAPPERAARGGRSRTPSGELPTPFDDLEALSAPPRSPRSTPFGSVWDRQPGAPAARPAANLAPLPDEEDDFEEPAIPEYLLTEQRRGQGGRGGGGARGGRGGGTRSAYTSAIERERYGGGRGGGTSRFAEPAPGRSGGQGGGGSQGSRGGRGGQQSPRGPRPERQDRVDRAPRTGGAEWSEVPPELEEMLRAQLQRGRPVETAPTQTAPAAGTAAPKRRTTRKPAAAAEAPATVAEAPAEPAAQTAQTAPKRRTTRKPAAAAEAPAAAVETAPTQTAPAAGTAAPKRRTTRKPAAAAEAPATVAEAPAEPAAQTAQTAPKRRTTRKPAAAAEAPAAAVETAPTQTAPAAGTAAPKRRTTRKPAAQPAED